MKFPVSIDSDRLNLIIAGLILPSLLLPIKYSSLILIIIGISSIYNVIYKKGKSSLSLYLLSPFLLYYFSIFISFTIDIFNHKFDATYLIRNISVILIPIFIYTSNFSKKQISKIIKISSLIITFIGFYFLVIWVYGFYKYNNKHEFQKKDWFKSEVIISKDYLTEKSIFDVLIKPTSRKPSLRKVIMLKDEQFGKLIKREIIVKVEKTNTEVWVLLRNVDKGICKVWFNVANGEVGSVKGKSNVKTEKLSGGFYKFTFSNKIEANLKREWFYISFVSNNGSYSWHENINENIKLEFLEPSLNIEKGENLLENKSLFEYKITNFSSLENYGHSTYLGLIFLLALIVLVFLFFFK